MKYFTNKNLIGGFSVLAIIAGLYFGYQVINNDVNLDVSQSTTSSEIQKKSNLNPPTAPAVLIETIPSTKVSEPAINADDENTQDSE